LIFGFCEGLKAGMALQIGSMERERWKLSLRIKGESVNSFPSGFPGLKIVLANDWG